VRSGEKLAPIRRDAKRFVAGQHIAQGRSRSMLDERQTLRILGWMVGSVVIGVMVLNAMALPF